MEKMVTDRSVTHVLVFSDKEYAEKANARKAGVGTESQIMSKEIYEKVDQKKFIPLVCEWTPDGEPYLPAFFQPRKWIDFSSPERVNENWDQLIRALYGKPLYTKPALGKPPSYLLDDEKIPLPTLGKFAALRQAILNTKPTVFFCRQDFLDAAIGYADSLRIRKQPQVEFFDEWVLQTFRTLLSLRDQLVDWITLEGAVANPTPFEETLINFLERLLGLKNRPAGAEIWQPQWDEAHALFVYELSVYTIAALIRLQHFGTLHSLFTAQYLLPESERSRRGRDFGTFADFYGCSQELHRRNQRLKLKWISLAAELIKERSTRADIPFRDVMQAELMIFLAATSFDFRWYPETLIYAGWGCPFPFFVRAAQHKIFAKLKTILGVSSGDELRKRFKEGCERLGVKRWDHFSMADVSLSDAANMKALDTI
jgi:hypothetical protein